jgi:spoIIIJ-associated protein
MTEELDKIKELAQEFFEKMTIEISAIEVNLSSADVVDLNIKLDEPQILIGQQGQTLSEIQRLLRFVLSRRLKKVLYLNLDINGYKSKKIEYLRNLAKETADQVSLAKEEKKLSPMTAFERRIIHSELSQRTDVVTESQGDGFDRCIVIKSR